MKVADQSYKARYTAWDPLAQEAYLVDRWSALSPFTNFQVLAYQLARTTLMTCLRPAALAGITAGPLSSTCALRTLFLAAAGLPTTPPTRSPWSPIPIP